MTEQLRNYFIQRHVERKQQAKAKQVANKDISEVVKELGEDNIPVSELRMKPNNTGLEYVLGVQTDDYRRAGVIINSLREHNYDSFSVNKEREDIPILDNVDERSVYGTMEVETRNGGVNVQVHDSCIFESHLFYLLECTGMNGVYTEPKGLLLE